MSEIPYRINYNVANKQLLDANYSVISSSDLAPFAVFGQKFWINLQLVLDGTPTKYTELQTGTSANIYVDNDYLNNSPRVSIPGGDGDWTAGTGSEYYYNGLEFATKPDELYLNNVLATEGTVGTLAAGTWGWHAGTERIYVRLSDGTDPDTKASGYVQIKFDPTSTPTAPFVSVMGSTFNQANTWYDLDTETMRTPDITDGEISFEVDATTYQFWTRIRDTSSAVAYMQIQLLAPSTASLFSILEFSFACKNKFESDDVTLHVAKITYTMAELDAIFMKKASPFDTEDNIVLFDTNGNAKASGTSIADLQGNLITFTSEDGSGIVWTADKVRITHNLNIAYPAFITLYVDGIQANKLVTITAGTANYLDIEFADAGGKTIITTAAKLIVAKY